MTITTHKLLVLFFCVSTTTAIAMQSKNIERKDMVKVLNKTAPIYKQPADISELLNLPREYPTTSPRKTEKKKVKNRNDARNNKYRFLQIK